MSDIFKRTCITLPTPVLKAGKRNAKARQRNFSNYVAALIREDDAQLNKRPAKAV